MAEAVLCKFMCPIEMCASRSFSDLKKLLNHMLLYHGESDGKTTFNCNIDQCLHNFRNVEAFRTHVRRRHADSYGAALSENRNDFLADRSGNELGNTETAAADDDDAEVTIVDEEDTVEKVIFALQKKIALFHLKHREEHFVSKVAMESIMKGVYDICLFLHTLFAETLAKHISHDSINPDTSLLLDYENSFLSNVFDKLMRNDQLKAYCMNNLSKVIPETVIFVDKVEQCTSEKTDSSVNDIAKSKQRHSADDIEQGKQDISTVKSPNFH
jgi:hypothetical protein